MTVASASYTTWKVCAIVGGHSGTGVEMERGEKKPRGRPVVKEMPERIDASPEEIAEVVLRAKPKRVWRFEEETKEKAR